MRSLESLRIALLSDHPPDDPQSWSGWPAGLLRGLREFVGEVAPVDTTPSPLVHRLATWSGAALGFRPADLRDPRAARSRLWTVAQAGRPMLGVRTIAARRRLAATGSVDGVIQIGAEYPAPSGCRMVTFQDSTLAQAVRAYPWLHLQGYSAADVERNVRRQRVAYSSAVACCAATHWVAESLRKDYTLSPSQVHVVGCGANHVVEGDIQRDWSRPRFLFVGGHWDRKNGDGLLRSFARMRESFSEATLDLVGRHPPVQQAGVITHGPRRLDDQRDRHYVEDLYRSATALVLPSLHEPLGTVYAEAAFAGIASIGTVNGGAATCIGDAGFLINPSEPEGLVEAMCELAKPEVAKALGERAARRAKLFTWRNVAERLVRALEIPGVDPAELADFLYPPERTRSAPATQGAAQYPVG